MGLVKECYICGYKQSLNRMVMFIVSEGYICLACKIKENGYWIDYCWDYGMPEMPEALK